MEQSELNKENHLEWIEELNAYSTIGEYTNFDGEIFKRPNPFAIKQQFSVKKTGLLSPILPVSFLDNGKNCESNNSEYPPNKQQKTLDRRISISENDKAHSLPSEIEDNHSLGGVLLNRKVLALTDNGDNHRTIEQLPVKNSRAPATLYINTNALKYNLTQFHQCLQGTTKIMFMIKANAYGCDLQPMSRWLEKTGMIDYLAVAFPDEGVQLRQCGSSHPIMVLNVNQSAFEVCRQYDLQPVIYSIELLEELIDWIEETSQSNEQVPKSFPGIHIEIDTGMCRLGINVNEIDEFLSIVKSCDFLKVKSIFSHLVASEDPNEDIFTENQATLFHPSAQQLERGLGYPVLKHLCNSPGIIRHHQLHFDMVRLGIGLYGLVPGQNLEPAVSLITSISQVHHLKKGESVSYNRRTKVDRDSWIGTIRIGFADGLRRQLGNGVGEVWVRNRRVPILGNVCMDMTMIDLTDVTTDDGILNEDVEIFGKHVSIHEVAKWCSTIPSEILTGMGRRVQRVYTEDE